MHKLTVFLMMGCLIAAFTAASWAQDASFRSQATQTVLKDDLDRAEGDATFMGTGYFTTLGDNKNIEIYSNLTNIAGAGHYLLDPTYTTPPGNFLIGTSGRLIPSVEALSTGIFLRLNSSETDRAFVLNGVACNGFGSFDTKTFNPNGTILEVSADMTDQFVTNNSGILLNDIYRLSDTRRAGLLLYRSDNNTIDTRAGVASRVFALDAQINPLGDVPNYGAGAFFTANTTPTQHSFNSVGSETYSQEYGQKFSSPSTIARLGLNTKLSEVLSNVDFYLEGGAVPNHDRDSGEYAHSVSAGPGSLLSQTQSFLVTTGRGGVLVGCGAGLNLGASQNTRTQLTVGYDGTFGSYDAKGSYSTIYDEVDATGPNATTLRGSESYADSASDGNYTATQITLSDLHTFKRGDHLEFGVGIGYQYSRSSTEYTDVIQQTQNSSFDDGTALGAGNYNGTYSYHYTQKVEDVTTSQVIRVPVGFGYKFGKTLNWEFRMGARADIRLLKENIDRTNDQLLNVSGSFYNNGTGVTTVISNPGVPLAVTNSNRGAVLNTTQTSVTYQYGLGWQPMDKMKVDLLTFFGGPVGAGGVGSLVDINLFRRLALSITFIF